MWKSSFLASHVEKVSILLPTHRDVLGPSFILSLVFISSASSQILFPQPECSLTSPQSSTFTVSVHLLRISKERRMLICKVGTFPTGPHNFRGVFEDSDSVLRWFDFGLGLSPG